MVMGISATFVMWRRAWLVNSTAQAKVGDTTGCHRVYHRVIIFINDLLGEFGGGGGWSIGMCLRR